MEVTGFLFEHQADLRQEFKTAWTNYSTTLNEITGGDAALIVARKQRAEECLYDGVCRTERIKVRSFRVNSGGNRAQAPENHEDDILAL